MNFKGNCLLARTVFECIAALAPPALGADRGAKTGALSDEQCAERLGYTDWTELKIVNQVVSMVTEGKPFTMQLDHLQRGKRWMAREAALHANFDAGGLQRAVAGYEKAIRAAPEDWMIRVAYGELLSGGGPAMAAAAEEQFIEALARIHHNAIIHYRLGEMYRNARRLEEAEGHFREALRLDPEYMRANFGLAEVHDARGERDEAIAIFQEQVRKGRNRLLALSILGEFYRRIGELDEARDQFEELLQESPDHMGALIRLGDIAAEQGRVDQAIEHYQAALRIWPEMPAVRERLARVRKHRSSP
jgi:tetratricopeptide (TPR) repeat protein